MKLRTVRNCGHAALMLLMSACLCGDFLQAELRSGDRVVLLGGTFIERLQGQGYLETVLQVNGPENVVYRNLGWSGDTVFGEARAVFGKPVDGFKRLEQDVRRIKPTVVVVAYGNNEAHGGQAGLARFKGGLSQLFDMLDSTEARIVALAPHRYEKRPAPLPSPGPYNKKLEAYRSLITAEAAARKYQVADLDQLFEHARPDALPLTDNGLHLTDYGYWQTAPELARMLGVRQLPWTVTVDAENGTHQAEGTRVRQAALSRTVVTMTLHDQRLPLPPPPPSPKSISKSPTAVRKIAAQALLRISGLADGRYRLLIDGVPHVAATNTQWAKGVRIRRIAGELQAEKLRQLIVRKNELYFHRYRPQNETYLFLFRKHEQGNNAVEIPQFEPLVAELEKRVAQLKTTRTHKYRLVPIDPEK